MTRTINDLRIRRASENDIPHITALLQESDLPTDGVPDHIGNFLVSESGGEVIGTIGMEVYGNTGLLRSACVKSKFQNKGIGKRLYDILLTYAREKGINEIVLLTTTAKQYFSRAGFETIDRQSISGTILASAEFQGACPSNAIVMRKVLI